LPLAPIQADDDLMIPALLYFVNIDQATRDVRVSSVSNQSAVIEYHEPGGANSVAMEFTAKCGANRLNLSVISTESTHVNLFRFGRRSLTKKHYLVLDQWLSGLRGQPQIRILCNYSGADIVFEEAFNRIPAPHRLREVSYFSGQLQLTDSR
jgi:hypothetical protein